VDDRHAERGAALAGGAEAGEQRALGGQVQVGVRHHDERVLAAQLEAGVLQVPAGQLADPDAHLGRAGEADLVDQPSCSAFSRPSKVAWPSACTVFRTPVGSPPATKMRASASPRAAEYSAGFQTTLLPHSSAGTRYQDGTATGKLPAVMMPATPTGHPEGEQLLVAHLARDRLAVEPASLAEEEVAGVDDLLHLAARLGDRLADLAGDQLGQRLGVGLDEPADAGDDLAAHRARGGGPGRLRGLGGAERLEHLVGAGERDLGDDVVEAGRVGGGRRAGGTDHGAPAITLSIGS
jgi:hypothetical protein